MGEFERKLLQATLVVSSIGTMIIIAFILGMAFGKQDLQKTIEDRALELPDPYEVDDAYSWGDIEYVVFGEKQE